MAELVSQAMRGDKEAFIKLMKMHEQGMYKVAWSYLNNEQDVADAMQEAILACYENLQNLRNPKYFKTWMYRILINKCNDCWGKKAECIELENMEEKGSEDSGFCRYEWQELLGHLDEKYRSAIVLYYFEGMSVKEIATALDINKNTVLTRLARARRELKKFLCEEGDYESARG